MKIFYISDMEICAYPLFNRAPWSKNTVFTNTSSQEKVSRPLLASFFGITLILKKGLWNGGFSRRHFWDLGGAKRPFQSSGCACNTCLTTQPPFFFLISPLTSSKSFIESENKCVDFSLINQWCLLLSSCKFLNPSLFFFFLVALRA